MKVQSKIEELKKEYANLIESTKGYLKDSKTFGFKPIELVAMQLKATEISQQIKQLENDKKRG